MDAQVLADEDVMLKLLDRSSQCVYATNVLYGDSGGVEQVRDCQGRRA